MDQENINELMSDFSSDGGPPKKYGAAITLWVSDGDHARYVKVQKLSRQMFGKKMKDIFRFALSEAERKLGIKN